jgi:hypothetical protein
MTDNELRKTAVEKTKPVAGETNPAASPNSVKSEKESNMPERKSERKRLSNLANAKNSTGPKTPEGMSRSAQNARKHGILSKEVVVNGGDGRESAVDFERLIESLHAQSLPQDAIEHLLIDRVAACYWRLRRAQRYEVGAVREGLDDCKTPLDGPGPNMKKHNASVRKLEMMLAIERHVHQEPTKGRQDSTPTDGSDQQAGDGSDPSLSNPATGESEDRFAKAEEAIHEYEGMTEYAEQQDALADSRRPLLAALPADEPLNRLIRYETMLDRQLHRALSELRRRSSNPLPPSEDANAKPANGQ